MEPSDRRQLPHLLKLVDDESPTAQQAVRRALTAFGPALRDILREWPEPLSIAQREALHTLLADARGRWLRAEWTAWQHGEPAGDDPADDVARLETGIVLLSRYIAGFRRLEELPAALDTLADDVRQSLPELTATALARELFAVRGFHGAKHDYYDPDNSDLLYVLHVGRGIPISLCLVYQLLGRRLGLDIRGCNFPGHFVAIVRDPGCEPVLVDCYDGGAIIDELTLAKLQPDTRRRLRLADVLQLEADSDAVLQRVVRNLANAFQRRGAAAENRLMTELLREHLPRKRPVPNEEVEPARRFEDGACIRHRRYGYRGLVVHADPRFSADEVWYRSNRYQPAKEQPWYYVLVHGSSNVAYAAQSSLQPDDSEAPIDHPLLEQFFYEPSPGRYIRNDTPWPAE